MTRPVRERDVVWHSNPLISYGRGVVQEVVPSPVRPASKAYVLFDGEPARRLVWLDDLELYNVLPLSRRLPLTSVTGVCSPGAA